MAWWRRDDRVPTEAEQSLARLQAGQDAVAEPYAPYEPLAPSVTEPSDPPGPGSMDDGPDDDPDDDLLVMVLEPPAAGGAGGAGAVLGCEVAYGTVRVGQAVQVRDNRRHETATVARLVVDGQPVETATDGDEVGVELAGLQVSWVTGDTEIVGAEEEWLPPQCVEVTAVDEHRRRRLTVTGRLTLGTVQVGDTLLHRRGSDVLGAVVVSAVVVRAGEPAADEVVLEAELFRRPTHGSEPGGVVVGDRLSTSPTATDAMG